MIAINVAVIIAIIAINIAIYIVTLFFVFPGRLCDIARYIASAKKIVTTLLQHSNILKKSFYLCSAKVRERARRI